MFRDLFEMDGFDVTTATSGKEAIEAYRNNLNIKLIISDSNMGEMSGIEFLKTLKATYDQIPIFYLSTGSFEQTEEYVKSLGGAGLFLKPFDLDEILIKIKKDLNL